MGDIIWKRIKPLTNSNNINDFEKNYGIILPDYFKMFVSINNGGRPNLDITKTVDGKEVEIKTFLSFNKEDIENIYNVIDYFKEEFDGNIIPIASEPSGNYFCIDLKDESIVYWEHEGREIKVIAENFTRFLNDLYKL